MKIKEETGIGGGIVRIKGARDIAKELVKEKKKSLSYVRWLELLHRVRTGGFSNLFLFFSMESF